MLLLVLVGKGKGEFKPLNNFNYQQISALTMLLKLHGDSRQSEHKSLLFAYNVLIPFQSVRKIRVCSFHCLCVALLMGCVYNNQSGLLQEQTAKSIATQPLLWLLTRTIDA